MQGVIRHSPYGAFLLHEEEYVWDTFPFSQKFPENAF